MKEMAFNPRGRMISEFGVELELFEQATKWKQSTPSQQQQRPLKWNKAWFLGQSEKKRKKGPAQLIIKDLSEMLI